MSKPPFRSLLATQLCFCLVLGILFGITSGLGWEFAKALSASLGGVVVVIANGWYLWRLGAIELGADSGKVLSAWYRAEIGKLFVLALVLAPLLVYRRQLSAVPLNMAMLFAGFLLGSAFVALSNARVLGRWLNENEIRNS